MKLRTLKIFTVFGYQKIGIAGNSQFNKMIIGFIAQVWPPTIVDSDPLASA